MYFGNNVYNRLITHMQIRYNTQCFLKWLNMKIEPRHDKTNEMIYAPSDDRSAWASTQSDQLRWPPEARFGRVLPIERTAKTLIRLGGCPGWSESSLCARLFCWFCHEAAENASSSSLNMQHIYISSHIFYIHFARNWIWSRLAMLTISYWDRISIYIV